MKRFLLTISCAFLALYVINFGIDIYVSHQLQKSRERRYVGWNDIIHRQLSADMVIMGSSRAWVQYDPSILDSILQIKVYNLGIDGSQLNRQIIKYNVYNHYQRKRPHYIIVNIDYCSTLGWTTGYEREQFFPHMLTPYTRNQIKSVEPFSFAELYIPLYRYTTYKGLFALLKEIFYDGGLVNGYQGQIREWDGIAYNDMKTFHFGKNDSTMKMFNEFLAERHAEGIKVIFCYAPIYIGLTKKVENMQEVYDTYESLADQYNIPILDYTYSDISKDSTYFYNATHLIKQGAEMFSVQLANDLDSLGIIQ